MFFLVQATDYHRHRNLLDRMYRLRKRVFHDELEWDVPVIGEFERDAYDDLSPAYLLWTDEERTTVYGSLRLLPTTGPTLLNDVFRRTYPKDLDLCHPTIWEGTRMCIDADEIAQDMPEIDPQQAMCMMLLALAECGLDNGIHTLISNYEPHMKRIYKRAGAPLTEVGKADGYGRRPVCCGLFEVSRRTIAQMREKMELSGLYVRDGAKRPTGASNAAWMSGGAGDQRSSWINAA